MKRRVMLAAAVVMLIVIGVAGCASRKVITYSESTVAAHQDEWLKKAYRYDENGWIFIHIEGEPFERGFQRGYLTANESEDFLNTLAHFQKFSTAKDLDYFVKAAVNLFKGKVSEEYLEEMRGYGSRNAESREKSDIRGGALHERIPRCRLLVAD